MNEKAWALMKAWNAWFWCVGLNAVMCFYNGRAALLEGKPWFTATWVVYGLMLLVWYAAWRWEQGRADEADRLLADAMELLRRMNERMELLDGQGLAKGFPPAPGQVL